MRNDSRGKRQTFYAKRVKKTQGNYLQTRDRRSKRLENIKASAIRRLFGLTKQIPDVINLGIGEPDFTPPPHILDAVKRALDDGKTHYVPSNGISELREVLAKKFSRDYGLFYRPEGETLVTVGATEAVALALQALLNPGDEVLIPNPGFVCYEPAVLIAGGTPISVPILEEDGFKPDIRNVTSLITNKSRVMIINSPNNPTGAVFSYNELAELGKLAVENDLIVVSDEVYDKIIYDNAKHYCLATFPGMRERTIVVNSFSKTYAMTGFRVGCAVGPQDLISAMLLVQQFTVACVDTIAQYAATAALEGPQDSVSAMVSMFNKRRKLVCERLGEMEHVRCFLPEGAFYAFPNIKEFEKTSAELSEYLLKEARVVVTPGSAFGKYGEGYLRLSYATSYERIAEALNRIERTIGKLGSRSLRKASCTGETTGFHHIT